MNVRIGRGNQYAMLAQGVSGKMNEGRLGGLARDCTTGEEDKAQLRLGPEETHTVK